LQHQQVATKYSNIEIHTLKKLINNEIAKKVKIFLVRKPGWLRVACSRKLVCPNETSTSLT
jgi:hypothetical protein